MAALQRRLIERIASCTGGAGALPRVEEGWLVYTPSRLVGLDSLSWAPECRCIIVSEPFTAIVEDGGERVPAAVPPGSLVCPPGCEAPAEPSYRLATPAWARGATVEQGPCPYHGGGDEAKVLEEASGVRLVDAPRSRVLEEGGVAVAQPGLDFEPVEKPCGRLEPLLATHPTAALLPPGVETCFERLLDPVRGSPWWGGVPVAGLRMGRRRYRIAARYGVLRGSRPEALLYTAWPPGPILAAYAAGVLYACGRRET